MAKKKKVVALIPYTFKVTLKDGKDVYLKGRTYDLCEKEYTQFKDYVFKKKNGKEGCKKC